MSLFHHSGRRGLGVFLCFTLLVSGIGSRGRSQPADVPTVEKIKSLALDFDSTKANKNGIVISGKFRNSGMYIYYAIACAANGNSMMLLYDKVSGVPSPLILLEGRRALIYDPTLNSFVRIADIGFKFELDVRDGRLLHSIGVLDMGEKSRIRLNLRGVLQATLDNIKLSMLNSSLVRIACGGADGAGIEAEVDIARREFRNFSLFVEDEALPPITIDYMNNGFNPGDDFFKPPDLPELEKKPEIQVIVLEDLQEKSKKDVRNYYLSQGYLSSMQKHRMSMYGSLRQDSEATRRDKLYTTVFRDCVLGPERLRILRLVGADEQDKRGGRK